MAPKITTPLDSLPVGRLGIISTEELRKAGVQGQRLHCKVA